MNTIKNRVEAIRSQMKIVGIDAWYISGTDPHGSEYLPDCWQTRAFISSFTGSFGIVVITATHAGLWTDTRYFLQAEEQLKGTDMQLHKLRVPDAVPPEKWLAENLQTGAVVGIDAKSISLAGFRNLRNTLAEKHITLIETNDFFESVWEKRPALPQKPIFDFEDKYAGLSRNAKLKQLIARLDEKGAGYMVVTTLDELAWLFNLRGDDILYNPVFMGFALIGKNESHLFVSASQIKQPLKSVLENDGIQIHLYHQYYDFLNGLIGEAVFIDPATSNYSTYSVLAKNNKIVEGTSPIALLKARKNETEKEGFRKAMLKDGVALVEFHFWLKEIIGKTRITEYEIGRKLAEFRAKQPDFMGESFAPIVGYKSHGAIVHLSVSAENALPVEAEGILLFDSGGQYLDGTTDITRTVALGMISEQQKIDFTLVLKGMIGLSMAKFPFGTKGCHLDILARKPLWDQGLNYGHGTGHGVGHFLSVHEGPMAIRQELNENNIEPGMVMSNEPAFYREGQYGLRTENMMVCVELETTAFGRFFGFETLTLCPIDKSLILSEMLTSDEKNWLNTYHKKVNRLLKPLLKAELHGFLYELTAEIV